jgi:signal transduction histidine kinase/CheY-like chemotaxis protein/HPt (histidine-containing phosphotransfer) domain-containing protein
MPPQSIYDALLSHEAMALFEFCGGGVLKPLATLPAWCESLWQARGDAAVQLGEKSPFLENFLAEAERFWTSEAPGSANSGYWVERDSSGTEFPLEASALWLAGRRILLIRSLPGAFAQQQQLFQSARDSLLTHERLVREIEKKEILLHCIIHDLSQPLTSMRSCFDLLLGKKLGPDLAKFVLTGRRESQRQERMIRGLLEAFSADLAGVPSSSQETAASADLVSCARRAVEQFAPAFIERGIELTLAPFWDFERGSRVVGDAPHVDRIFGNLLENALRYSPNGSTVTVGLEDGGPALMAFVDDEGSGLPKDSNHHLFALFGKGRDRPGKAGLGLYFCKITVERWGGSIGAEKRAEGGTRFWFRLPRALEGTAVSPGPPVRPHSPMAPDAGAKPPIKALHLVVADDDEISRALVIETLRARGHSVTGAADGGEALAAFERLKPEAMLIDQHMPEADGLAVARAIRRREQRSGAKPAILIGLSGNASAEDERRAKQAGMDALIGKPFEPEVLFQAIERATPAFVAGTASDGARPPEDLRAHLARMTAGNDKLARKLVASFLKDFPPRLSEIERAVIHKNAEELASAAHSLQGAFAIFDAKKSVVAARNLEKMGRERRFDGAIEQFGALSEDLSRLEHELHALFPQPSSGAKRQPSRNPAPTRRKR